ncbi:hypothetical protein Halha_2060 [Halobacteroides halobius DSM 5150]|uniref:Endolytic murein transglycosylase n=1 Tax=Halobacteroides halobius (strain ATCC 35273 / DSM 5150 / MD-1) TaxID=748449 RepID=L0KC58_HALHC|nr:endolytic transglycosylase MltG [Halobacteroides halobius]AGB41954.1 hypothetical protein Halha_2060 [Halobacteroides halobius DSM 5150]
MAINKWLKKSTIWLLTIIIGIGVFYFSYQLFKPRNENKMSAQVIAIKSGTSLNEITNDLYEESIIRSPLFFELYLRIRGLTTEIKAGHYRLTSKMSMLDIIDKLIKGKTAFYEFTVPEGMTVKEIATKLSNYGFNSKDFLKIVKKKKLKWLPERSKVNYNLEGFLFPATYYLSYDSFEKDVVKKMLEEFKERINPLQMEVKKSDYNLYQIITIASLIQAEAKLEEEMNLISSVIYNRLKRGMKLQLDATVQYALDKHKSKLFYSDLEVDSPYNTYKNYGLPPGPINNPGIKAIKAALNPAKTDYLYYVATEDGKHKFTKTYKAHLRVQKELKDK